MPKVTPGFNPSVKPVHCTRCNALLQYRPASGEPTYDIYTGDKIMSGKGDYVCPSYKEDQRDGGNGHTLVYFDGTVYFDETWNGW